MSPSPPSHYELYYWPTLQGRGELVRMVLEDAGAAYVDVARLPPEQGGGFPAMKRFLEGRGPELAPFAPPFLRDNDLVIAQTALILQYLAPRLGLVPSDEKSRLRAHQIALTIGDLLAEVHDTHHPIGSGLYYEDQKPEAKRRSDEFVATRLPKFFNWFERALETTGHFVGDAVSYVDIELFQLVEGLRFAFPNAMKRVEPKCPRVVALHALVGARPRLAAYLASPRRLPFNQQGIFRSYPELDAR